MLLTCSTPLHFCAFTNKFQRHTNSTRYVFLLVYSVDCNPHTHTHTFLCVIEWGHCVPTCSVCVPIRCVYVCVFVAPTFGDFFEFTLPPLGTVPGLVLSPEVLECTLVDTHTNQKFIFNHPTAACHLCLTFQQASSLRTVYKLIFYQKDAR